MCRKGLSWQNLAGKLYGHMSLLKPIKYPYCVTDVSDNKSTIFAYAHSRRDGNHKSLPMIRENFGISYYGIGIKSRDIIEWSSNFKPPN